MKNKKLIVQVLVVMVPVILIMTSLLLMIVYNSTVNGFLEAQNSHMEYLLKNDVQIQLFTTPDELGWYLDYWSEHPKVLKVLVLVTNRVVNNNQTLSSP